MSSLSRPAESVVPAGCTDAARRGRLGRPRRPSRPDPVRAPLHLHDARRVSRPRRGLGRHPRPARGVRRRLGRVDLRRRHRRERLAALRGLRAGRVVFTVPPEPAPCGATALKPLFMACDHWRRTGVLDDVEVAPGAARRRHRSGSTARTRGSRRRWRRTASACHREARVAGLEGRRVTLATPAGEETIEDVAFAHVVPHYRAPGWVVDAGLAGDGPGGPGGRRPADDAAPPPPRRLVAR